MQAYWITKETPKTPAAYWIPKTKITKESGESNTSHVSSNQLSGRSSGDYSYTQEPLGRTANLNKVDKPLEGNPNFGMTRN